MNKRRKILTLVGLVVFGLIIFFHYCDSLFHRGQFKIGVSGAWHGGRYHEGAILMDVNVRDYGAIGNDIHDDTLAFRNALNAIRATGGTCTVPAGTYNIAASGIMGVSGNAAVTSNMHLVGDAQLVSKLHVHTAATGHLIRCGGEKFSVENLTIDMSNLDALTNVWPIAVTPIINYNVSMGWKIKNCRLINVGLGAIVVYASRNWTVDGCYVLCNNPSAHPIRKGILMTPSGPGHLSPTYGTITNNVLDGCPIGGGTSYTIWKNNHVYRNGWGAGIYTTFDGGRSVDDIFIANSCEFGNEGIDDSQNGRFFQTAGFELVSARSLILHNVANSNKGHGIVLFGPDNVMAFNRTMNNGTPTVHSSGIVVNGSTLTNLRSLNASRSIILGNISFDTRVAAGKTQDYGIWVARDWIRNVSVIANNFHGNAIGEGLYQNVQPNVSVLVGRDLFRHLPTPKQREMTRSLLDSSMNLTNNDYLVLNQLLTGSSLPTP
jgi:hypothetical protein